MARIYVRKTGNDGTGTGSYDLPFLTIAAASAVWTARDVIDVGAGTFEEVDEVAIVNGGVIVGAGFSQTIVRPLSTSFTWCNFASGLIDYFVVANLTLDQAATDFTIFSVTTVAANARLYLTRCLVKLQDGYLVDYRSVASGTFDVLNCVVTSRLSGYGGTVFHSTQPHCVGARNSVFTRLNLVTEDAQGGRAADLNFNLFFDNERGLRIGEYGEQDIVEKDPKFASQTLYTFGFDSPLHNGGEDLTAGYGIIERDPPVELNWLANSLYPDIGLRELFMPSASLQTRAANMHLLLDAMAVEVQRVDDDMAASRTNRSVDDADLFELQRRVGANLDIYRIASMTDAEYRTFLKEMQTLSISQAPAAEAVTRPVEMLYEVFPIRYDYSKVRRFPLSSKLKLTAVHAVPSDDTLTVRLSAGELQLERSWHRAIQTDLVLPAGSVSLIYVDGSLEADGTLEILQSTDLDLLAGFDPTNLTGTAAFRVGSFDVIGSGTLFTTEITRHQKIRPAGTLRLYVVDEVIDDEHLTLRKKYQDDDFNGVVEFAKPVVVFGRVTTDADTITAIDCPGYLGTSTYLDSRAAKGHAFHTVLNVVDSILDDTDMTLNLLLKILGNLKPAHKRGYLSFLAEFPVGKVAGQIPSSEQSIVSYEESAESTDWPVA